mmetsp:Transcript_7023/g.17913  ORF Transcript_7023/g.17913 Transcript_7023/m.17913 type:complete len:128 (+) Transcript_7023:829-1212(+)
MTVSFEAPPVQGEDGEGSLQGMKLEGMAVELEAVANGELSTVADCVMLDEVLSGGAEQHCRRQLVSFLPTPLTVSKGSKVQMEGGYDASTGHFKFISSAVVPTVTDPAPGDPPPSADPTSKAAQHVG